MKNSGVKLRSQLQPEYGVEGMNLKVKKAEIGG